MAEKTERMVLRSVYLPEALDEQLRSAAFLMRRSKGDLIREFLQAGLARFHAEYRLSAHVSERTEPLRRMMARELAAANVPEIKAQELARQRRRRARRPADGRGR